MTSYVIARTLGDPTASTSHKSTTEPDPTIADGASGGAGTIPISGLPPTQGESVLRVSAAGAIAEPATATTSTYFLDGDGEGEYDGAARLAGVGVFSPVASMPGSPTLSRRRSFRREGEEGSTASASVSASGSMLHVLPETEHQRGHERNASGGSGVNGGGESTSEESSFTLLEREESFEDPMHIRRRVPGPAGADADD